LNILSDFNSAPPSKSLENSILPLKAESELKATPKSITNVIVVPNHR